MKVKDVYVGNICKYDDEEAKYKVDARTLLLMVSDDLYQDLRNQRMYYQGIDTSKKTLIYGVDNKSLTNVSSLFDVQSEDIELSELEQKLKGKNSR